MRYTKVEVLETELAQVYDALHSAYYQNLALDMLEAYRAQDNRQKVSPLTKRLEAAVGALQRYLEIDEEDDPE